MLPQRVTLESACSEEDLARSAYLQADTSHRSLYLDTRFGGAFRAPNLGSRKGTKTCTPEMWPSPGRPRRGPLQLGVHLGLPTSSHEEPCEARPAPEEGSEGRERKCLNGTRCENRYKYTRSGNNYRRGVNTPQLYLERLHGQPERLESNDRNGNFRWEGGLSA